MGNVQYPLLGFFITVLLPYLVVSWTLLTIFISLPRPLLCLTAMQLTLLILVHVDHNLLHYHVVTMCVLRLMEELCYL